MLKKYSFDSKKLNFTNTLTTINFVFTDEPAFLNTLIFNLILRFSNLCHENNSNLNKYPLFLKVPTVHLKK